jgi:hypothetical protein
MKKGVKIKYKGGDTMLFNITSTNSEYEKQEKNKFNLLDRDGQELFESAVLAIFLLMGRDPKKYHMDIRFREIV